VQLSTWLANPQPMVIFRYGKCHSEKRKLIQC